MFNKHPKGLVAAALANMGERFGFLHYDGSPYSVYLSEIRFVRNCDRIYLFCLFMHQFIYWHWQAV